jgi:hypothetical protein
MKVHLRHAEAWIWFTGDQPLAAGGLEVDTAKRLGKAFEFLEIGAAPRADQLQMWVANRGSMKAGSTRRSTDEKIQILSARGVETDLAVDVQGDSDDAHVALDAVWHCLAGDGAASVESLGKVFDKTVMVVEFPVEFGAVFPAAALTQRFVSEKLKLYDGREPQEPQHRMAIEYTSNVGRRPIPRQVRFEPRVSSTSARVIYTESPLRTDDHLAWLTAVAEALRSQRG